MEHHHHHHDCCPGHYGYEADYLEDPDYIANDTRHQVPMISSIGRGPRGAGIIIKEKEGADGSYRLDFVNDLTNETLASTPNMDPGYFEIKSTKHDSVDGESKVINIAWIHGGEVKSWDITIPPGAHGSRLFLSGKEFKYNAGLTYQTTVDDLIHYGRSNWQDKPMPRPNDIVCFKYEGGKEYRSLAFGTIEAVEKGQVVFTSRTTIDIPVPSVGKNSHWYVDGKDTGVTAQGPKGEKGDTGPRGLTGKQGPKGDKGAKGDRGDAGIDGKDAKIEIGTVTTLAPTMSASVSAERDAKTNVTTLNFGIPEGAPGKAINIRGGIWKPEFLPPFDETPVNDAFIVYDNDKQFDLYVRGEYPVQAELGGPWTVVENWQGRPGSSVRYMIEPKIMMTEVGQSIEISTAEAESVFQYYDYLADDDLVIDSRGTVGIISSAEDNSGTYVITTVGHLNIPARWEYIEGKPDTYPTTWDEVDGKPDMSDYVAKEEFEDELEASESFTDLKDKVLDIDDYTTGINLLRETRDFATGTESAGVYESGIKKDGWFGFNGTTIYDRYIDDEGYGVFQIKNTDSAHAYTASYVIPELIADKTVTVSFEIMFDEQPTANSAPLFQILPHDVSSAESETAIYARLSSNIEGYTYKDFPLHKWVKVVAQLEVPYYEDRYYRIAVYSSSGHGARRYRKVKLELGSINNPIWSPSPFDYPTIAELPSDTTAIPVSSIDKIYKEVFNKS